MGTASPHAWLQMSDTAKLPSGHVVNVRHARPPRVVAGRHPPQAPPAEATGSEAIGIYSDGAMEALAVHPHSDGGAVMANQPERRRRSPEITARPRRARTTTSTGIESRFGSRRAGKRTTDTSADSEDHELPWQRPPRPWQSWT